MFRLCLLSILAIPSIAFAASVEFAHIEYNPDGSDAKREWVQVTNVSGTALDLSGWKLYENKTNHTLKPLGSSILAAGASAVIADDAATYVAEYPGSAHVVFDSSFSLSNSGETLELRDGAGVVQGSVSYAGDAKKTGPATEPRVLTARVADTATPVVQSVRGSIAPWLAALLGLIALAGYSLIDLRRQAKVGSGYKIVAVEHKSK